MPGVASLQAYQYYGNPRNYLWRLLYAIFGDGRAPESEYVKRIAFALGQGIALWDVIASCERNGSLDSDIKQAVPNDITGLLAEYPRITKIVCNGTKSYSELNKHFGSHVEITKRVVLRMPSTSPIPTKHYRSFEDRLKAWQVIKET